MHIHTIKVKLKSFQKTCGKYAENIKNLRARTFTDPDDDVLVTEYFSHESDKLLLFLSPTHVFFYHVLLLIVL